MGWKLPAGILTAVLLSGILWIKRKKAGGLNVYKRIQGQTGWDELEDSGIRDSWDEPEDSRGPVDWDEAEGSGGQSDWDEGENNSENKDDSL